jgi:glycosyltransferase involved in cell wall biosynthesis
MHTIVRITTIPISLKVLLKGQLEFMQQNGFKVIAVSSDGNEIDALKQQEGCEHFIVPLTRKINPIQDVICIIKLIKLLKKIKPAIVHTHTPKAGLIGMIAACLARVPIRLHTIAGLPWITTTGAKKYFFKTIERITAAASSKIYVNSKSLLLYLKQQNLANKKFSVLGAGTSNGIDVEYFVKSNKIEEESTFLKQINEIKEDAWVWLFVGRIVKDKGIQELVEAFCDYQKIYNTDQLWLVGELEGNLDPLDGETITILNSNASIKKFGFQNDVRPYYEAANVLVFPSYREGFPNVPMQAALMDCGLILSDINGCNEIVENNKTGLLVNVKSSKDILNRMFFVRENEAKFNQYKQEVKKKIVANFEKSVVWENLLNEYKSLINKNGL